MRISATFCRQSYFPFRKTPVVISRKKSRGGKRGAFSFSCTHTHAGDEVGQSVCSSSVFSVPRGASAAMNEKHRRRRRRRRRREGNRVEIFPMEKGKRKALLQGRAQAKPLHLCGKKIASTDSHSVLSQFSVPRQNFFKKVINKKVLSSHSHMKQQNQSFLCLNTHGTA